MDVGTETFLTRQKSQVCFNEPEAVKFLQSGWRLGPLIHLLDDCWTTGP